jgi:two-component sensor histidine kinase
MVNELVLNAIKHMDLAAPGGRIEIVFEHSAQGETLRIRNPAKGVPAGFDFGNGRGLGTGLGLVKSLMPPRGASLVIGFTGTEVEATLTLAAPVVVERTAVSGSITPGPAREHQTVAAWKSEES